MIIYHRRLINMNVKIFLIAVYYCVFTISQQSESGSQCLGPPTVNCNCGASSQGGSASDQSTNIHGRVGPKGQKGERGLPDNITDALKPLERKIEEQNEKLKELQKTIDWVTGAARYKTFNLVFNSPSSCTEVSGQRNRKSGKYFLSLEKNALPIRVFCNFENGGAETIIKHNQSNEVEVANCDSKRCSKHKLIYDLTMPQIVSLIQRSSECRQFIKYRCYNSVLNHGNPTHATWLSRAGTPQIYWGGATSRKDHYCACGETHSCANRNYKCNCDANDNVMRSDEGYLTDKTKLPVTEVQFGDASRPERGWFTVGPLICSG